jgi:CBS domain-containing protein
MVDQQPLTRRTAMKVADVSAHTLVRVDKSVSLREAAVELRDNEVGVLVAEDSHGVSGIFSERDLARAVADDADLDVVQVREYMTESPLTVDQDAPVEEAIGLMHRFGFRHVVVSENDEPCGLISARDVLRMLAPDVARITQG